jgi:hypothetical protein
MKAPWTRYERIPVEITFVPDGQLSVEGYSLSGSGPNNSQPVTNNQSETVARFRTDLIPDIGGMPATLVAALLPQHGARSMELGANHKLAASRLRVPEEAPMVEQTAGRKELSVVINLSDPLSSSPANLTVFAQQGAKVEQTDDSFTITVSARSPGKPQRIEVEIPWPDGLEFHEDEFLSVEFRLRP